MTLDAADLLTVAIAGVPNCCVQSQVLSVVSEAGSLESGSADRQAGQVCAARSPSPVAVVRARVSVQQQPARTSSGWLIRLPLSRQRVSIRHSARILRAAMGGLATRNADSHSLATTQTEVKRQHARVVKICRSPAQNRELRIGGGDAHFCRDAPVDSGVPYSPGCRCDLFRTRARPAASVFR